MDKRTLLSTMWIFLTVNFLFCDVFTLMHAEDLKNLLTGRIDDMEITQEFLLGFAVVMEIPMLMIVLSRVLPVSPNRIVNLLFGTLLAIVQIWSLSVGKTTLHYAFFSTVEIAACFAIVWIAFRWKKADLA